MSKTLNLHHLHSMSSRSLVHHHYTSIENDQCLGVVNWLKAMAKKHEGVGWMWPDARTRFFVHNGRHFGSCRGVRLLRELASGRNNYYARNFILEHEDQQLMLREEKRATALQFYASPLSAIGRAGRTRVLGTEELETVCNLRSNILSVKIHINSILHNVRLTRFERYCTCSYGWPAITGKYTCTGR